MKKSTRNLYSILSLLPALFFVIYMFLFVSMMVGIFSNMDEMHNDPEHFFPFENMGGVMIAGIIMAVVGLAVLGIFIMHVVNNKSLAENERIIWIVVFLFAGMIGFPIYWFLKGIKYEMSRQQPVIS